MDGIILIPFEKNRGDAFQENGFRVLGYWVALTEEKPLLGSYIPLKILSPGNWD